MASHTQRNDRSKPKYNPAGPRQGGGAPFRRGPTGDPTEWVWGWHAVTAALDNPLRPPPLRILASPDRTEALRARDDGESLTIETIESTMISQLLPGAAVHQGLALRSPLWKASTWKTWPRRRPVCC